MNESKLKNNIKKFGISLSYIIIFILTLFISISFFKTNCYYLDDDMSIFYGYNLEPYHGVFPIVLINRFFGFTLPHLLHIHPQNFLIGAGSIILATLFSLVALSISSISFNKKKYNILYPFVFLLVFGFIYKQIFTISICEFLIREGFYRFLFPFIFYSLLLIKIMDLFTKSALPSKKDITILSFYSFLLACMGEVFAFTSFFTLISVIAVISLSLSNSELNLSKKERIKKLATLFFPILFSLLGTIILVSNQGFLNHVNIKITGYDVSEHWFDFLSIKYFLIDFIKYVFLFHRKVICALVLITILFYKYLNFENKRLLILADIVMSSILAFNIALYVMGSTQYFGGFWVRHPDMILLILIFTIIVLMFMIRILINLLEGLSDKNLKNNVLIFVFIFLLMQNLTYLKYNNDSYTRIALPLKKMREAVYVRDKLMLFYTYKNQKVILPYYVYYINLWNIYNQVPYENYEKNARVEECYYEGYFNDVYGLKKIEYGFDEDNIALKKFKEAGGSLTNDEIKASDFQKLLDKDFVLNIQKK